MTRRATILLFSDFFTAPGWATKSIQLAWILMKSGLVRCDHFIVRMKTIDSFTL
jgi:hypothetical protein